MMIEKLIDELANLQTQNAASDALVKEGAKAVPGLLKRLIATIALDHRKAIFRVLLSIKDPRTEDPFRATLKSNDEDLRAMAARGLHALGAPDALSAAIATINDSPDMLHADLTPAVYTLAEIGLPAIPDVLNLLNSDDRFTRMHAQRALERITRARRTQSDWQALWEQNGAYNFDAPADQRARSIEAWRRWYTTQK
jgi:HEAT repeat protein